MYNEGGIRDGGMKEWRERDEVLRDVGWRVKG